MQEYVSVSVCLWMYVYVAIFAAELATRGPLQLARNVRTYAFWSPALTLSLDEGLLT